eukprot:1287901-Rhodomonas_salina.1
MRSLGIGSRGASPTGHRSLSPGARSSSPVERLSLPRIGELPRKDSGERMHAQMTFAAPDQDEGFLRPRPG